MEEPDNGLPPVPVVLAAGDAVGDSVRHALWVIEEVDLACTGTEKACAFALTDPSYLLHEPLEVLDGPEWCERAGLPGSEWRATIVLAADWQGFSAGQPLDEVRQRDPCARCACCGWYPHALPRVCAAAIPLCLHTL